MGEGFPPQDSEQRPNLLSLLTVPEVRVGLKATGVVALSGVGSHSHGVAPVAEATRREESG